MSGKTMFSTKRFIDSYYKKIGDLHLKNVPFNFLGYSINERKNWDLDTNILGIGASRIGKSTFFMRLAELIYYLNNRPFTTEYVDKSIVWNAIQSYTAWQNIVNGFIQVDEGYFLVDKRSSMDYVQIKYIQLQNALASKKNITATAMQDMSDLDSRVIKKLDILALIYERGTALIFAKHHAFPIIPLPIINLERFKKAPYLLSDPERAKYELSREPSFIFEVKFKKFPDSDPFWQYYKQVKAREQENAVEKIQEVYERITSNKEETAPLDMNMDKLIEMIKRQNI